MEATKGTMLASILVCVALSRVAQSTWHDPWLPSSTKAVTVPVELHGTTYRMWAQEVGPSEAAVSVFVLNGGPGKPHTELDGLSAVWPAFRFIHWDTLGSHGSECFNRSEACTWHPEKWANLEDFVTQAQAVLNYFKLAPANTILLGHSFGVVLALELAVHAEKQVPYLGLVLSDWVANQARVTSWYKQHPCQLLLPNQSGLSPNCSFIDTHQHPPPYVAYTFGSDNPGPLGKFVWGSQAEVNSGWIESWDRSKDLASIQSPAIWLVGDHDLVNPKDVEADAERMPRGRFAKLLGAGHNSFADEPRQWTHHINRWLHNQVALPQHDNATFASVADRISLKFSEGSHFTAAISNIVRLPPVATSFVLLVACVACGIRCSRVGCCSFGVSAYQVAPLMCESE